MVFTHGPQLLVKLGGYLVGAEILHGLKNKVEIRECGHERKA